MFQFDLACVQHSFFFFFFFAGIELKRIARLVESDLPLSTASVCTSVRPAVISNLSV